jgi:hypothetical protein
MFVCLFFSLHNGVISDNTTTIKQQQQQQQHSYPNTKTQKCEN